MAMVPVSLLSVLLKSLGCRDLIQKDVRPDNWVVLTPVAEAEPCVLPINLGEKRRCWGVSYPSAVSSVRRFSIG